MKYVFLKKLTNRNAQFSADIYDMIKSLPVFEISLSDYNYNDDGDEDNDFVARINITIEIKMKNYHILKNSKGGYLGFAHQFIILVGDENRNIVHLSRVR